MRLDLSKYDGITPGEWGCKIKNDMCYITENRVRPTGKTLTSMTPRASCAGEKYLPKQERDANAQAIADLPLILEELKRVYTELDEATGLLKGATFLMGAPEEGTIGDRTAKSIEAFLTRIREEQ